MLVLVRIVQSHYKAKLVYLLILNLNFQRRNKHCPFYWEFNNTNFFDMKDQREKNVTNKGLEKQMEDRAINKCCHCFISYCYNSYSPSERSMYLATVERNKFLRFIFSWKIYFVCIFFQLMFCTCCLISHLNIFHNS